MSSLTDLSSTERVIVDALRDGPKHIDELGLTTHLTSSVLNATVTILEIGGIIRDSGGKVYVLR